MRRSPVRSVPGYSLWFTCQALPGRAWARRPLKHIRLWVKDTFTRTFKPTLTDNPFCSLSPSQSWGNQGLDPDLPGPEPERAHVLPLQQPQTSESCQGLPCCPGDPAEPVAEPGTQHLQAHPVHSPAPRAPAGCAHAMRLAFASGPGVLGCFLQSGWEIPCSVGGFPVASD